MAESKEDKRYHSEEKKYYSIEELVRNLFGEASRIIRMDRIYGGDINDAYRMTLSGGEHIFVKANSIRNKDFFLTESRGLGALRSTGEIGVPRFLGTGIDEQRNISFLALEYIESVPRCDSYWETFGHQLARLHRADCLRFVRAEVGSGEYGGEHAVEYEGTKYGFAGDNYIGASPQKNRPSRKWTDFYRECRLLPQFRRAEKYFDSAVKKKVDWLLERLDSWLIDIRIEFPSLLHGDLWSGNMMCGPTGEPGSSTPAALCGGF